MLVGIDRIAFAQFMISRPIVVGPLTGFLLGDAMVGLEIGMLLELLWLGRLPVGAAIPPDDTQVAVGATVLAFAMGHLLGFEGMPIVLLCVLTAIPLGKCGQGFDRLARKFNDHLNNKALAALEREDLSRVESLHVAGLLSFALASLATVLVIVVCGSVILFLAAPTLIGAVREAGLGLQYSLIMVGAAALMGSINVNRSFWLFSAAFTGTLLAMWLR
jgi:PTS system mannose-specific IIC component